MVKQHNKYQQLEEQMRTMGRFFSEYFRKTMARPVLHEKIELTILEIKGLAAFVDVNESYTMSALSKNAHLPLPNMTLIINRFEKRGIAKRFRDDKDRRVVRVQLTFRGKTMLGHFLTDRGLELERTLGKLSQLDQKQLCDALNKATEILLKIRN
jgi:DNA-binding MarR family transcriptional regulator